jgi:hypothetical protein
MHGKSMLRGEFRLNRLESELNGRRKHQVMP